VLLLLFVVAGFVRGPFFGAQQPPSGPPPQAPRVAMAGKAIWVASANPSSAFADRSTTGGASIETHSNAATFIFRETGRAEVTFPEFTPPYMAVALVAASPGSDGTMTLTVRAERDRSVAVRINTLTQYAELTFQNATTGTVELLGSPVPILGVKQGRPFEVAVIARGSSYSLFVDGESVLDTLDDRLSATGTASALSLSVTGTSGSIALLELRVHEAP
jgi:hypothetical protein